MTDGQTAERPRQIPKSVPFMLIYILCERYSSMGVAIILVIFLNTKLELSESMSTAIFHYFYFASYFLGIFGGIVADNWLGRFKTLLFGASILGGIGNILLVIGTVEYWKFLMSTFTVIGLILISFGVGFLEPNLPAYIGDQYKIPLEEKGFAFCIGLMFIMMNAARLLSLLFSPQLRDNVECLGASDCYPLIFGLFVISKTIAIICIVVGRRFAVVRLPQGNMFMKFCGAIWHGLKSKFIARPKTKRPHWLDYSDEKYGSTVVSDTKRILHIVALLPPLAITASLYFQQSSRWVFQSRQMNGDIGLLTILPDQMPLVNVISVAFFVPFCEYVLNPALTKIGIKTSLERVILGGFLSALSFIIAAILQFQVDQREIHILWQIPQHIVLALGEVLVYVQILEFGYTQAPKEMKSVIQAFLSMVIGGGNLIVAVIASTKIFDQIAYEYLMFAGIVFLAMLIFSFLALRYKYVVVETDDKKNVDIVGKESEYEGFKLV